MRFIVTGTPRSGTRYASRLMAALGLPCTHEKTLRPSAEVVEVLGWPALDTGESSWMAWMLRPMLVAAGCDLPVLVTVRDPWSVIDSLSNRNHILAGMIPHVSGVQGVRHTINAFLPHVMQLKKRIDRSAALVIGWNELIEANVPADERHYLQVDRLNVPAVADMLDWLGVRRTKEEIAAALSEVSTRTNAGYTVDKVPGVSDPDVARWVAEYAKQQDCGRVVTHKVRDVAARQTPAELVAEMSPELAEAVNGYAERHGYRTVEIPALVVA